MLVPLDVEGYSTVPHRRRALPFVREARREWREIIVSARHREDCEQLRVELGLIVSRSAIVSASIFAIRPLSVSNREPRASSSTRRASSGTSSSRIGTPAARRAPSRLREPGEALRSCGLDQNV